MINKRCSFNVAPQQPGPHTLQLYHSLVFESSQTVLKQPMEYSVRLSSFGGFPLQLPESAVAEESFDHLPW